MPQIDYYHHLLVPVPLEQSDDWREKNTKKFHMLTNRDGKTKHKKVYFI